MDVDVSVETLIGSSGFSVGAAGGSLGSVVDATSTADVGVREASLSLEGGSVNEDCSPVSISKVVRSGVPRKTDHNPMEKAIPVAVASDKTIHCGNFCCGADGTRSLSALVLKESSAGSTRDRFIEAVLVRGSDNSCSIDGVAASICTMLLQFGQATIFPTASLRSTRSSALHVTHWMV